MQRTTSLIIGSMQIGGQALHDDDGKTNSLDFDNATGSERLEFLDGTTDTMEVRRGIAFTAEFPGGVDTKWGLKDSADSIAYIIAEGLGTDKESNNPDVAMAFEFEFALVYKDEILETLQNGVVFHLSPEKIPEPSSASTSQRCFNRRAASPQTLSKKFLGIIKTNEYCFLFIVKTGIRLVRVPVVCLKGNAGILGLVC